MVLDCSWWFLVVVSGCWCLLGFLIVPGGSWLFFWWLSMVLDDFFRFMVVLDGS